MLIRSVELIVPEYAFGVRNRMRQTPGPFPRRICRAWKAFAPLLLDSDYNVAWAIETQDDGKCFAISLDANDYSDTTFKTLEKL